MRSWDRLFNTEVPETDTQKTERLERSWKSLGPLRRITFTFRFFCDIPDEEDTSERDAHEFCMTLKKNGYEYEFYKGYGGYKVKIITEMEPSHHFISLTEKKLNHLAGHKNYHYDGWAYPDKLKVEFWPDRDGGPKVDFLSRERAMVDRGRILFGETLAKDPFDNSSDDNFQIVPRLFLRTALRQQPRAPQPTVSAFAQWVYSLYANAWGDADDRARGKEMEEAVWELRKSAERSLDDDMLRRNFRGWNLIHNGLHLRERPDAHPFSIPALKIDGSPLRASPDLMYRNAASGEVIIVELKNSYMTIPANLWPNLWAQLWCYAQIDVARQAPKLTVVGEIWANRRVYLGRRDPPVDVVALRASQRRDPRTPRYDRFFRTLFDIYRGKLHP